MALGILGIISIIIIIAALGSLLAVSLKQGKIVENNRVFTLIAIIVVVISAVVFTSYPSNYILAKCLAGLWVILAIVARLVKGMDKFKIARVLLSISIIGAAAQYLLF